MGGAQKLAIDLCSRGLEGPSTWAFAGGLGTVSASSWKGLVGESEFEPPPLWSELDSTLKRTIFECAAGTDVVDTYTLV